MRLLDRYLFRELLTPLAYCLGGLVLLGNCFTLFGELEKLQESRLHFLDMLEYSVATTPEFLVTVLPITLLFALLYALTHHARYNEITAMRTAGISLWRICAPYFMVGVAASGASFALNELLVPVSTDWATHIKNRYVQNADNAEVQKTFQGFTSPHRQWQFGEYKIKTAEMIRPIVFWKTPNGSIQQLHADLAVWTNHVWTFFNAAEYSQADAQSPLVPSLQTNELAMPDFDETPSQIKSEIKVNGYLRLGGVSQANIPLKDILGYLRLHPDPPRSASDRLLTELNERLAAPWTCLVVVFIAIPCGAMSGRRNFFFGVAGIIAIGFIYFVIQKVSYAFGSGGELPGWLAAWLPNLIFGATGLILMARAR
jgi:lipopolysaccharide export system permease protein